MSATAQFPPKIDSPQAKERAWREWISIGVGLSGVVSIVALIVSLVALGGGSSAGTMNMAVPAASVGGSAGLAAGVASAAAAPQTVTMKFRSDVEHGKRGPDGTWHDAAVPGIFTVHAGAKITVIAENYDVAPHSFTAPTLNVSQVVPKGTASHPSEVKFTFTAPAAAGRYAWWCAFPCDPFAMTHDGYMRGYVTVTA